MNFIAPYAGQTNPFLDLISVEKKSCETREKHLFYSCDCYPHFARALNITEKSGCSELTSRCLTMGHP